jgi:hypothetical protein
VARRRMPSERLSGCGVGGWNAMSPAGKTNVPAGVLRPAGTKWGVGVRQALFPVPTFGAHLAAAAGFPTPFSAANGVSGLVAGPSNLSRDWISSEAFQLASANGYATGLRTRSRHVCDFSFAS